jgi:hypothetical protein
MENEGTVLLKGKETRSCWRSKCFVCWLIVGVVLAALGVSVAFLFPRSPSLVIHSVGLPKSEPVVSLVPPTLSIPVSVTLLIANDNFFAINSLAGTRVVGLYDSAVLNSAVPLGWTAPASLTINSRAATLVQVDVHLLYSVFASPVVLGEIVQDCATRGFFQMQLNVHLLLHVLFLLNLTIDVQTSTNVSCVAG